jgi:hypothetical protein
MLLYITREYKLYIYIYIYANYLILLYTNY